MLELVNLNIDIINSGRKIADGFSFTLDRGDKAVMIGEEGNGKSTLLKLIYDEKLTEGYCGHTGKIIKKGMIGYLPQTMDERYSELSAAEYFGDTDLYTHTDILKRMGIDPEFARSGQRINTMSGGEKVKIQLAKILMNQPDILLLDEPTNDIDIETLEWLEDFIKNSKQPVLYVSHDETLIENTANVIIHMEQLIRKTQCRITVTRSGYREYIAARKADFDKQTQIAKKQRSDHADQMERWRQIYSRVDHEQETISRADPGGGRLLKKKMKAVKAQEKRYERQAENFIDYPSVEEAVLAEFNGNINIPGGKVILDYKSDELKIGDKRLARNIALRITGKEHIGITGRNGAGKSTLLLSVWQLLKERSDIITGYMPQNYNEKLDGSMSPVEYLSGRGTKDEITRARTYMGSMRFTHEEMTGRISELSGGQKAKILFLEMILQNADVLILDEPTRNFSPVSCPEIRRNLKNFGGAIISVSHDRKYLAEACDKVYELTENGLELKTFN